jgi:hypothetical protein
LGLSFRKKIVDLVFPGHDLALDPFQFVLCGTLVVGLQ